MDYIKKVINEISCLITDTVMTEQEGSRRCITTEDLNGFEEWITWLEKASDGNQANSESTNCAIFDVSKSACIKGFEAKSHYCFECENENDCDIT